MTPSIQQTWVWCHEQSRGTGNCEVVKRLQFLPREVQNWPSCHSKTQNEKKPEKQQVRDFCYAHERAQVTGQPSGPKSGESQARGQPWLSGTGRSQTLEEELGWGDWWISGGCQVYVGKRPQIWGHRRSLEGCFAKNPTGCSQNRLGESRESLLHGAEPGERNTGISIETLSSLSPSEQKP